MSGGRKWREKPTTWGDIDHSWWGCFIHRLHAFSPRSLYKLQTLWWNTFHLVNKLLLSQSFSCNKSKYTLPEILSKNSPVGAGKFHHKPQTKVLLNGNKHSSIRSTPVTTCRTSLPCIPRSCCVAGTVIIKSKISIVMGSEGEKSGHQMSKTQH